MIDNVDNPINEVPVNTPVQETAKQPRNQHLKSADPKKHQFTGRATEAETQIINKAIVARRKQLGIPENGPYDIVRFALDAIKYIKGDIFSSFKVG